MPTIVKSHGPLNARIAIVGEAPGRKEEELGRPFVGASGGLLSVMLSDAGLSKDQCRLMNIMETRPPNNDFGAFYEDKKRLCPKGILLEGQQRLRDEITRLSPNLIIALGDEPLYCLTGKRGIKQWRGSLVETKVGKVLPTYHPAFILRKYDERPVSQCDYHKAAKECTSPTFERPDISIKVRPTFSDVMEWLDRNRHSERCSFDTETLGRLVRCLGLGVDSHSAICIPFLAVQKVRKDGKTLVMAPQSENCSYWSEKEEIAILAKLSDFFQNSKTKFIAQNASFDIPLMERNFGIYPRNLWFDTMHAQKLAYPELPKSLDFLTSVYTNLGYYADYDASDDYSTWVYNCMDVIATFQCVDPIISELKERDLELFYFRHAHPMIKALIRVQERGVLIDVKNRKTLAQPLEIELAEIRKTFKEKYKIEFKKQVSPKQVQEALLKLGILVPVQYDRKKGKVYTTNKRAIDGLIAQHPNEPFFSLLLDQREKQKFYGTYVTSRLDDDDRMRTSYDASGTPNGRISSSASLWGTGGNNQNIPKSPFRRTFIAPKNRVFLHADLSQAESRVVAWLSRNTTIIDRFINDSNFDVHRWKASQIYGRPEDSISPIQRQRAKACNHSGNYQIAYRKFAYISKIPLLEAKPLLAAHQNDPFLQGWWASVQRQLRENRTLVTPDPFFRKRTFYGRLESETFRIAYNFVPQSTVGDIINRALWILDELLDPEVAEVILQVHDELDLEVDENYVREVGLIVHRAMTVPLIVHPDLPPLIIPVEISYGPNWWDQPNVITLTQEEQKYESQLRRNVGTIGDYVYSRREDKV